MDKIMTMFIIKVICERGEGNEFKYNRGNFTILSRRIKTTKVITEIFRLRPQSVFRKTSV